jgi:uncharacterized protein
MKEPLLAHLTPATKLIFLVLLIISTFILFSFAGILLAIPLFHINVLKDLTILSDYKNPGTVNLLKYLQVVQSFGLFIIPASFCGWLFGRRPLNYFGMNKSSEIPVYFFTFLILFVSLPLIGWLTSVNEMIRLPEALKGIEQWMKETEDEAARITELFLNVKTVGGLLFNILLIAVIPAIGEELFFRGLLQRLFSEWFKNIHVAIFIIAFLFAAIHMQFYGIIPRMFLGLLFGYLYYWTGSLWVPIFAHFINNASAVILSYVANQGSVSTNYEDFGTTSNVMFIIGSAIFTGVLLFAVFHYNRHIRAQ